MRLFLREIGRAGPISFFSLQERLLETLRSRIREGVITERGVARASGLSQPHVHNILKGVRAPSFASADALLSVLDPAAIADVFQFAQARPDEPHAGIPVLNGVAGPGRPWIDGCDLEGPARFPCRVLSGMRDPAALRVAADPEMRTAVELVAVDQAVDAQTFPRTDERYVVVVGGCGLIRWVRPGSNCLYLATDISLYRPASWLRARTDIRVIARVPASITLAADA